MGWALPGQDSVVRWRLEQTPSGLVEVVANTKRHNAV